MRACVRACLPVCMSICMYICLSVYLSVCVYVCLSHCLVPLMTMNVITDKHSLSDLFVKASTGGVKGTANFKLDEVSRQLALIDNLKQMMAATCSMCYLCSLYYQVLSLLLHSHKTIHKHKFIFLCLPSTC